jgi:hypothetical protein
LPVVLHECEICTLTSGEEHKLWVFEKLALRKTFGTKTNKITEDWEKLHYEELHELIFLSEDEMGEV